MDTTTSFQIVQRGDTKQWWIQYPDGGERGPWVSEFVAKAIAKVEPLSPAASLAERLERVQRSQNESAASSSSQDEATPNEESPPAAPSEAPQNPSLSQLRGAVNQLGFKPGQPVGYAETGNGERHRVSGMPVGRVTLDDEIVLADGSTVAISAVKRVLNGDQEAVYDGQDSEPAPSPEVTPEAPSFDYKAQQKRRKKEREHYNAAQRHHGTQNKNAPVTTPQAAPQLAPQGKSLEELRRELQSDEEFEPPWFLGPPDSQGEAPQGEDAAPVAPAPSTTSRSTTKAAPGLGVARPLPPAPTLRTPATPTAPTPNGAPAPNGAPTQAPTHLPVNAPPPNGAPSNGGPPSNNGGPPSNGGSGGGNNSGGNKFKAPVPTHIRPHRVWQNEGVKVYGHHLKSVTGVSANGAQGTVLEATNTRVTLQIPAGVAGPVTLVLTYQDSATNISGSVTVPGSVFVRDGDAPDADNPDNDDDAAGSMDSGGMDYAAAIRTMAMAAPYRLRPLLYTAARMAPAIQGSISSARQAGRGATFADWTRHSAETSPYQKWQKSRSFAQDLAAKAADNPGDDALQARAQKAAGIVDARKGVMLQAGAAGGAAGFGIGQVMGTSGIGGAAGGALGTAFGPVASIVGSVVGSLIEKTIGVVIGAAKQAIANIKQAGDIGESVGQNIGAGIKNTAKALFQAGEEIAHTILSGVLSPLGRSGSALGGFARQVTGTVGRVGDIAGDGLTAGLGLVGKGAGLAVGGAGALAGGAIGMLGGGLGLLAGPLIAPIGAMVGAAMGVVVMKIVAAATEMAGKVVSVFGKALGELGGVVAGAVKTAMDIVQDVVETATQTAKSILSINQLGGYGVGTASNLVSTLGMFGMSPQQTAGRFSSLMSPLMTRYGSEAIGMPDMAENPDDFLRTGAKRFEAAQKLGPLGVAHYRMMLNAGLGSGTDEQFIPMFGLGEKRINKVLDFKEGMNMSPAAVEGFGKDMVVLQGMISGFADFLKITLGTALLPILETGLNKAVEYVKGHQTDIVDGIWKTVEFIYAKLPTYLAKGFQFVLHAVDGFLDGVTGLIKSFTDGSSMFLKVVSNILHGIDRMSETFKGFLQVLINITKIGLSLLSAMPGGNFIAPALQTAVGIASNAVNATPTMHTGDDFDAWYKKKQPEIQAFSDKADKWNTVRKGYADQADKAAQKIVDGEKDRMDAMSVWRQIADNTKKTADTNEQSLGVLAGVDAQLRRMGVAGGIFDPSARSLFDQIARGMADSRLRALQNAG